MKKTRILIGIPVLIIIALVVYFGFFRQEKAKYSLVKVSRQQIVQEVSESGTVKTGEELNLSFKNSGTIKKIYVKVGDKVKNGDPLAKMDSTELAVELTQAQASLSVAQAQYQKLVAGASLEEIKTAQTAVANAQTALDSANQNLADVTATARQSKNSAYEDAVNTLNDAYLEAYNSFQVVKTLQNTYFTSYDQTSANVKQNRDTIEGNLNEIKSQLDTIKQESSEANIDSGLTAVKKSLDSIYQNLTSVRQSCEDANYRTTVSSTDKTSLDTHKANINTVMTNVTTIQQTISSTEIANTTNINTAQSKVLTAQGVLKTAQDELSQLTAAPRQEDLDLNQAKVKEAEAQVNLLKNQIYESTILSPTEGQITDIQKKEGETVQPTVPVLSLISSHPFQVKVDIYEEDIVKVKVGNPVSIKLTAFPDKTFKGKVVATDPAEKLVDNVVYYETTIDFEETVPEIKPGMTADIVITTATKDNVLAIPESAIKTKDSKTFVNVLENKTTKEQQIEIGLKGSNDMVEVLSGLNEGEEIIID